MAACETLKLLCLFHLGFVLCDPQLQQRVIYGTLNGNVTFPVAAFIYFKEILWKKGNNKVMEWEVGFQPDPRSFPPFIGRTILNKESGDLSIFNLTYSDEDEYELESPDIKDNIKFRLEVIDPNLQVNMVVSNTTVPKNATFQLDCGIVSRSSWDSHFTVTWYFLKTKVPRRKGSPDLEAQEEEEVLEEEEEEAAPREQTELLSVGLDGVFGQEGCPWKGRLSFQSLSPLRHRLRVLQARPQDTGSYSCRVEEWLRSPQGTWYRLMEQESAPIGVRVLGRGDGIHVPDTDSTQKSVIYSNALVYFLFCCTILLFLTILIITVLCVLGKCRCPWENTNRRTWCPWWGSDNHTSSSPQAPWAPVAQQPPRAIDQGPWWTSALETVLCCPCSVTGQWTAPDTSAGGD